MKRPWANSSVRSTERHIEGTDTRASLELACATKRSTAVERLESEDCHSDLIRTHIADLPPNVQNLLADEFERKALTLHAKLKAKYTEVEKDKNRLSALNRRQSGKIGHLRTALEEASSKVVEQSRRITRLESEIASERDSHERAEKANSECADESANAWYKPHP